MTYLESLLAFGVTSDSCWAMYADFSDGLCLHLFNQLMKLWQREGTDAHLSWCSSVGGLRVSSLGLSSTCLEVTWEILDVVQNIMNTQSLVSCQEWPFSAPCPYWRTVYKHCNAYETQHIRNSNGFQCLEFGWPWHRFDHTRILR